MENLHFVVPNFIFLRALKYFVPPLLKIYFNSLHIFKVDLVEKYGKLKFNLDYYTEVRMFHNFSLTSALDGGGGGGDLTGALDK